MHACSSVLETREKQDKVYLLDESVLPVTEKERRGKEKKSIGPRMKNGHTNLDSLLGGQKDMSERRIATDLYYYYGEIEYKIKAC